MLVQQMVDTRRGLELALGVIVDPAWGPVVMLALGGVGVEALGLASWRSCPVAESEVDGMIAEIQGAGPAARRAPRATRAGPGMLCVERYLASRGSPRPTRASRWRSTRWSSCRVATASSLSTSAWRGRERRS